MLPTTPAHVLVDGEGRIAGRRVLHTPVVGDDTLSASIASGTLQMPAQYPLGEKMRHGFVFCILRELQIARKTYRGEPMPPLWYRAYIFPRSARKLTPQQTFVRT
jgi:hypothetical protein